MLTVFEGAKGGRIKFMKMVTTGSCEAKGLPYSFPRRTMGMRSMKAGPYQRNKFAVQPLIAFLFCITQSLQFAFSLRREAVRQALELCQSV